MLQHKSATLALLWGISWSFIFVHATNPFLPNTLFQKAQVQNIPEEHLQPAKDSPTAVCQPTGPIEATQCNYEAIESVNDELYTNLGGLVRTPFFKYFQVDIYRECAFWPVPGLCMDMQCAITTVDESEVPEKWRAAALSKIDSSSTDNLHQLPGCYYRDSDFCFLDDMTEGDYFDLTLVPERFTGYSGPSANRVWSSIYEENCFGLSEGTLGTDNNDECTEKQVYFQLISGLHASISTHTCHEYLNQTTGEWTPNLQCFVTRVGAHPERLQNIYFTTVLLLRAIARLGPYLSAYDYCSTGTHEEDAPTLAKLAKVISIAQDVGKFDETLLFRGENANTLKEEFKTHFRNVTRIMDCVGCDKCRLWGKVQTMGIATALKVLFELDETSLDPHSNSNLLQRVEVVALVNTLARFSESLKAVDEFRQMWTGANTSHSARGELLDNENALKRAQVHLRTLLRACERGAKEYVGVVLDAWDWAVSFFIPSAKGSGRGSAHGEL